MFHVRNHDLIKFHLSVSVKSNGPAKVSYPTGIFCQVIEGILSLTFCIFVQDVASADGELSGDEVTLVPEQLETLHT